MRFLVESETEVWWAVTMVYTDFPGGGALGGVVWVWHENGGLWGLKRRLTEYGWERRQGIEGLWFLVSKHSWISSTVICTTPHHITNFPKLWSRSRDPLTNLSLSRPSAPQKEIIRCNMKTCLRWFVWLKLRNKEPSRSGVDSSSEGGFITPGSSVHVYVHSQFNKNTQWHRDTCR